MSTTSRAASILGLGMKIRTHHLRTSPGLRGNHNLLWRAAVKWNLIWDSIWPEQDVTLMWVEIWTHRCAILGLKISNVVIIVTGFFCLTITTSHCTEAGNTGPWNWYIGRARVEIRCSLRIQNLRLSLHSTHRHHTSYSRRGKRSLHRQADRVFDFRLIMRQALVLVQKILLWIETELNAVQ